MMVDFKKASELAMKTESIESKIHTAWDFGSFYLFSIAPTYIRSSDLYDTGTIFTAVDKRTGRVYDYDITSDLDAFERATVISK